MVKISEIRRHTLLELAEMIRADETSSREITELLVERIKATEPKVHAYVTLNQKALSQARSIDKRSRAGRAGPLMGIPISFKDNFETRGVRTTCSSEILRNHVPDEDATAVGKLKASGAIVLGKLNMHEFGQGGLTPPTRNPWNLRCIAGGSSGGSASAVSALSAAAATGTDTGGSIRGPASFCGVVGLKPTYGRVSRKGVFPSSWSLDHVGPIARRVEDIAVMLECMAGTDSADPTAADEPVPDYVRALRTEFRGLRLGIPRNHFFEGGDGRVSRVVRRAVDELVGLGCKLVEFSFPQIGGIQKARQTIEMCEAASYHRNWLESASGKYKPDVRSALEMGLDVPAVDYIEALRYRSKVFPDVVRLFKRFEVVVVPTMAVVATEVGERLDEETIMRCTGAFNLLGLPALSMPCGFVEGLPVGMQLVGKPFDEAAILRVGLAFERATELYLREPPGLT